MKQFRLGVTLPHYYDGSGPLDVVGRARLAEQLGFDDLWCPDHVLFRRPIGDAQVIAAMAAAATSRIAICLGVLQAATRHPLALAKWLGTLAYESDGRLVAGLGVGGDYATEWEALGLSPAERGRRFDEVLAVLPPLLEGKGLSHDGPFHSFDVEPLFPAPPPPLPIWIGARLDGAIRRAALVDGWLGMNRWPDEFAEQRRLLLAEADRLQSPPPQTGMYFVASVEGTDAEAKRRCADFYRACYGLPADRGERRAVGGLTQVCDLIAGYREAGADRVGVQIIDAPEHAWERVAEACR